MLFWLSCTPGLTLSLGTGTFFPKEKHYLCQNIMTMQQLQLLICLKYCTRNDFRLLVWNEVDWMKQRPCRNSNPGHEFFQKLTVANNTEIQDKRNINFPAYCHVASWRGSMGQPPACALPACPSYHTRPSQQARFTCLLHLPRMCWKTSKSLHMLCWASMWLQGRHGQTFLVLLCISYLHQMMQFSRRAISWSK